MNQEPPFTLYDAYLGPQAGSFALVAEHQLRYTDDKKKEHAWTGTAELAFSITAPRLALPAGDVIHAVHPPANAAAPFHTTLPFISFTRRSLPWERPVAKPAAAARDDAHGQDAKRTPPWLALLVLTPEDMADAVLRTIPGEALGVAADAAQVYSPWTDGAPPTLALDPADRQAQVRVLEMAADRFRGLCPGPDELPFLAGVRRVSVARKEGPGGDAERDYAILLANRFPADGLNTAVVVSLEGLAGWLASPATEHPRVRVVVLHAWQFHSRKGHGTCAEQVMRLRARALTFTDKRLRKLAGEGAEVAAVRGALKLGYSPIAYQPADEERSFAWYRGPLAPVLVEPFPDAAEAFVKADAALVVDETTGMTDLSYTSAWQLGQLLALSSSSFGAAARAVSEGVYRRALREAEGAEAAGQPRAPKIERTLADALEEHLREKALRACHEARRAKLAKQGTRAEATALDARRAPLDDEPLRVMADWLAALALLETVPLRYLVPSKKLLPERSLRVFHVDPRWMDALVDGALSVGAASLTERAALRSPRGKLRRVLRRALLDRLRAARGEPPPEDEAAKDLARDFAAVFARDLERKPEPVCGFLLRAPLLKDFPGVEIELRGAGGAPLPVLRMDQVAEGVLLVLALGRAEHILVREPREGLRFGAETKGAARVLTPRDRSGKPRGGTLDVPLRAAAGVVDVQALVTTMKSQGWFDAEAAGALHALQWVLPPADVKIPWRRSADLATWNPGSEPPAEKP